MWGGGKIGWVRKDLGRVPNAYTIDVACGGRDRSDARAHKQKHRRTHTHTRDAPLGCEADAVPALGGVELHHHDAVRPKHLGLLLFGGLGGWWDGWDAVGFGVGWMDELNGMG